MAKQNYRCAGCGTRIDPGQQINVSNPERAFRVSLPVLYKVITVGGFPFILGLFTLKHLSAPPNCVCVTCPSLRLHQEAALL